MKRSRPATTHERQAARGEPCLIRLPGCGSLGGDETTVGAHYRLAGYCGAGTKPKDVPFMAFGCAYCHAVCDGRLPIPAGCTRDQVRLWHAEGCMRTAVILLERADRRIAEAMILGEKLRNQPFRL